MFRYFGRWDILERYKINWILYSKGISRTLLKDRKLKLSVFEKNGFPFKL